MIQSRPSRRFSSERVPVSAVPGRRRKTSTTAPQPPPSSDTQQPAPRPSSLSDNLPHHWPAPPSVKGWAVFSDLHVSPRTVTTALEVLKSVHSEAKRNGFGVLFLGDFWHSRGALPVEPLNKVIEELKSWGDDLPTLMLTGNHDQTALGGEVHSLEAFASIRPDSLHVFARPSLYLNALWLPYRRSSEELQEAIAQAAREGDLRAIFCHADIRGARVNDTFQASMGVAPDLFPQGLPVYSGHYHAPHSIPGTNVTYVGSPYQVSRAEEGQSKRLLILDPLHWTVQDSIPLDIGPRHITLRGSQAPTFLSRALQTLPAKSSDASLLSSLLQGRQGETLAHEASTSAPSLPGGLRKGDRLRLAIEEAAGKDEREAVDRLRAHGVDVELIVRSRAAKSRLESAAGSGVPDTPASLFQRYCELKGLSPAVLQEGLAILHEVLQTQQGSNRREAGGAGSTLTTTAPASSDRPLPIDLGTGRTILFERLVLEGFGPFRSPVEYPLDSGCIRVVSGENRDDPGSESNGSGKSSLVMAPLWALRGDGEGELAGKLTRSDVVHDAAKEARVVLEGTVNGRPFLLERSTSRTSLKSLRFVLDGSDLTCLDARQTQAVIDEALGTELLVATSFKSQASVVALLNATDKELKEQVGAVVGLEVWERAREAAAALVRGVKSRRQELEAAAGFLQRELGSLNERLFATEQESARFQQEFSLRLQGSQTATRAAVLALSQQHDRLLEARARTSHFLGAALDPVSLTVQDHAWRRVVQSAEAGTLAELSTPTPASATVSSSNVQALQAHKEHILQRISQLEVELDVVEEKVSSLQQTVGKRSSEARVLEGRRDAAADRLDAMTNLASKSKNPLTALGVASEKAVCDRCLQPLAPELLDRNLRQLEGEVAALRGSLERAAALEAEANGELEEVLKERQSLLSSIHKFEAEGGRLDREMAEVSNELVRLNARSSAQREEASRQASFLRDRLQRSLDALADAVRSSASLEVETGSFLAELERRQLLDPAALQSGTPLAPPVAALEVARDLGLQGLVDELERHRVALLSAGEGLLSLQQRVDFSLQQLASVMGERDPAESALSMLRGLIQDKNARLTETRSLLEDAEKRLAALTETERALGRSGIQGFVIEGAVLELQNRSNLYLEALTGCFHLELRPFKAKAAGSVARGKRSGARKASGEEGAAEEEEVVERIEKVIYVQLPNGQRFERSLRQCSGGERRRVALAVTLAFRDLVADRAGVRSNLLVLDEVMQLLDAEGTRRVCDVLRSPLSSESGGSVDPTILLVAQAGSIPVRQFAIVDIVSKQQGSSIVEVGVGRGV